MKRMTLDELERLTKDCLTPTEIAGVLGCDPYNINVQVKEDKRNGVNSFPFPTILLGSRVKIPRLAFIEAMKHGSNADAVQPV